MPLRAHESDVSRAMILVEFVPLIMCTSLLSLVRESKLCHDHSLSPVMKDMSKLRWAKMADGAFFTSEVTRKQRRSAYAPGFDLERLCVKNTGSQVVNQSPTNDLPQ